MREICEGFVYKRSETMGYVGVGAPLGGFAGFAAGWLGVGACRAWGFGIFGALFVYGRKHVFGFSNLH